MKKIVTIIGARPQFIKAATVSRAIGNHPEIREVLVHTGQHYDVNMSDIFFEQMAIPRPDYNLGIGGGTHGSMTGRQLEKIEEVLLAEKPDWVLVYGDTNSTLAGALAAAKLHIPVAHVEAGLRSFNRCMPEEINRVLTDHLSTLLFSPTDAARKNLLAEGIADDKIHVVGDVMNDAALFYKQFAVKPHWFDALGVNKGEYVLCTIHRAENTDTTERIRSLFQGLGDTAQTIILPLHPRTRRRLAELDVRVADNIRITDPVGYLEMVWLEMNCSIVATDSGGVQKEAYFHGKFCVTLRNETEWVELVSSGFNHVVGHDSTAITTAITSFINTTHDNINEKKIYGDGNASALLIDILSLNL